MLLREAADVRISSIDTFLQFHFPNIEYFWEYYFMKCLFFENWTSEALEEKRVLQYHLPESYFQDAVQLEFFVPPENMDCRVSDGYQ